jgi:UDP-sulfoquinovose synthase
MSTTRPTSETILILGGDGYLGWSLGLAFANRTNKRVVLVDNLIKRKWEKEVSAKLLVPMKKPEARVAAYRKIYGKSNLSFVKLDLLNKKSVNKLIKKYQPTVIINAAQQPSAPFSMMNAKNAGVTFLNNIVGHLNVLWAIAETDKNIKYIKLGSAGCYSDTDTDYLPLEKKDFTFKHEGKMRKIMQSFMPMQATDFYHQSKISDFLIDDLCAKVWNLKVITIQQATIFGATIKENNDPSKHELSARFNYDAVFSTVLNRFMCQLVIGHPITIYGDGQQRTGLISLSDTVENIMRLAKPTTKVTPGNHLVIHNYTHRLSIEEIANLLVKIDPTINIQYIKNPRKEMVGVLSREVEVHSTINKNTSKLENELTKLLKFTRQYKNNIDESIIMPKILWDKQQEAVEKSGSLLSLKFPTLKLRAVRSQLAAVRNYMF